ADVSALIAKNDLNIVCMEVDRKNFTTDVYVEMERNDKTPDKKKLRELMRAIPDLAKTRFVKTMPLEKREKQFKVVLDNISDAVVSIDKKGRITTVNRVARKIIGYKEKDLIGKKINDIALPDYSILNCLEGRAYQHRKKNLINEKGRFQFFATGRPITDSSSRIVGAVEIGKDMKEIEMLAQSISMPCQITFSDFIGKNDAIRQAMSFAQKIAKTDTIVSIRGESGTGKELFARAIHTESERLGEFIPVNCAALPETLLESELFGYTGGAFTGAKKEGKPGLFEMANNGTIFLDELAEMPPGPQAKILRVIQEKCIRRVGGSKEIYINTRIITATNKNLEDMVKEQVFREDLYYRINVLPIHIPPLRERIEDIAILVEHFLFQLSSRLDLKAPSITQEALNKLRLHSWPGNVRELKNVIERAAILSDSDRIESEYIMFGFKIGKNIGQAENPGQPSDHSPGQFPGQENQTLPSLINEFEKKIIKDALKDAKSIRKTAKSLGISHTTLLNKMKKHGLSAN
ncbi:sigma 54-interacting transcriptional regulator, partial [Desulfobacterales bacterium HSG16]|nr:sigma 54-interacting transcriptional regulator [Desulfobacterales bacterium HSG16]